MCFVWASLYICFLLKKTLQCDAVGHDWRSNLITLCSYCIGPLLWAIITYKRAGHKNVVLMSMIKFFKVYSPLLTRFTNGVKRFQNLPFSLTDFSNTSFSSISFLHHIHMLMLLIYVINLKKKKKNVSVWSTAHVASQIVKVDVTPSTRTEVNKFNACALTNKRSDIPGLTSHCLSTLTSVYMDNLKKKRER